MALCVVSSPRIKQLGEYEVLHTLGVGQFCRVKLGKSVDTGQLVALKFLHENANSKDAIRQILNELSVLRTLDHPHIIKLHSDLNEAELAKLQEDQQTTPSSAQHLLARTPVLVMEFASSGELFNYLFHTGPFSEVLARTLFLQLLSAVEYCHSRGVVHRDIKPEQLLLDQDFRLKLADFGFARAWQLPENAGQEEMARVMRSTSVCGTTRYMAPEVLRCRSTSVHFNSHENRGGGGGGLLFSPRGRVSSLSPLSPTSSARSSTTQPSPMAISMAPGFDARLADLWSCGITLFVMLTGFPPFSVPDMTDHFYRLFNQPRNFWEYIRVHRRCHLSAEAQDFLTKILTPNPDARPSLAQLQSHQWLLGPTLSGEELVSEMQPRQRLMRQRMDAEAL